MYALYGTIRRRSESSEKNRDKFLEHWKEMNIVFLGK